MSNSPSFPNMPADSSLPEIGMYDPGTSSSNQSAGGKTKVQPSADSPHPGEQVGYGYMSPALKDVGYASGENTSGIPAAQPIDPITFGDPNDTTLDFRDGSNPNTVTIRGGGAGDITRRGFNGPAM